MSRVITFRLDGKVCAVRLEKGLYSKVDEESKAWNMSVGDFVRYLLSERYSNIKSDITIKEDRVEVKRDLW